MNFHDQRGHYEYVAKWLESQDLEIDWEALKQTDWWVAPADWVPPPKWSLPQPFPRPLTAQMVTNLLLAREKRGLEIPEWVVDPMEQRESLKLVDPGEGGIEPRLAGDLTTGLSYWEKFLLQLESVQLTKISISLVGEEDRRVLVKWARVEEELRERDRVRNCERVARQNRGEVSTISRKAIPTLIDRANRGSLESIAELERRGWDEEEIKIWRGKAIAKAERMRGLATKRMEDRGKVFNREVKVSGGVMKEVKGSDGERSGAELRDEGQKAGIERELEVIRVGPNPRILTCRFKELAEERVCLVMVKSIANFVKGMRFEMKEPVDEAEYRAAWKYEGALPRFKGKW